MAENNTLKQTPNWVLLSLIPVFGGLAIVWAGYRAKMPKWMQIGGGITLGAFIISLLNQPGLVWLFVAIQIGTALSLKKPFLIKMSKRGDILPTDRSTAQLLTELRGKVDINNCSKDDLVKVLGMPIVYANNIELIKREGYLFTHIEELNELADIPEHYCDVIEPMVVFTYYNNNLKSLNWHRVNTLSIEDLILQGIDPDSAMVIVDERIKNGEYRSFLDINRRTGLAIRYYRDLA